MQNISLLEYLVYRNRATYQQEEAGNGALSSLKLYILNPLPFRCMSGHGATGDALDSSGGSNVIGMSMHECDL